MGRSYFSFCFIQYLPRNFLLSYFLTFLLSFNTNTNTNTNTNLGD
ncbi:MULTISPECIES: hypothetical protein [Acinetobacter]|nr:MULTISPECIES: hypothetical protein [Acinetobacter]MCS4297524.1 hypothetical protein [Acinetobacter guillouiae]MCW2249795.1 hypothetical protein [Acinetobacter sp. BIGb0204]NII38899.1 hypothetical protein [Acinetobacter sp. BIGb0196]